MAEDGQTSRQRAAVYLKAAFQALAERGGSLPFREIKKEVETRVQLSAFDRHVYEKTGYVRWESVLLLYSIDCVKAGFLVKARGQWHITPEGEAAANLAGPEFLDRAQRAYRAWRATQKDGTPPVVDLSLNGRDIREEQRPSLVLETAESDARNEIEGRVWSLGPYEFQNLVAALLRGMGYSTPFIAPKGPDGGTDVLAYPDPLGARTPHIRVQVKHRQNTKATRDEIAALRGIIRQDREIGLFVSTAGFTSDAVREARHGAVHIELMSLDELLEQWMAFYERIEEDDKGLLRLRRVFFLAPE